MSDKIYLCNVLQLSIDLLPNPDNIKQDDEPRRGEASHPGREKRGGGGEGRPEQVETFISQIIQFHNALTLYSLSYLVKNAQVDIEWQLGYKY